jgi:hypothetical protein
MTCPKEIVDGLPHSSAGQPVLEALRWLPAG